MTQSAHLFLNAGRKATAFKIRYPHFRRDYPRCDVDIFFFSFSNRYDILQGESEIQLWQKLRYIMTSRRQQPACRIFLLINT